MNHRTGSDAEPSRFIQQITQFLPNRDLFTAMQCSRLWYDSSLCFLCLRSTSPPIPTVPDKPQQVDVNPTPPISKIVLSNRTRKVHWPLLWAVSSGVAHLGEASDHKLRNRRSEELILNMLQHKCERCRRSVSSNRKGRSAVLMTCLDPTRGGNFLVFHAIRTGMMRVLRLLCSDHRVLKAVPMSRVVSEAIKCGDESMVQLIVESLNVNITWDILSSVRHGSKEPILIVLLDRALSQEEFGDVLHRIHTNLWQSIIALSLHRVASMLLSDSRYRLSFNQMKSIVKMAINAGSSQIAKLVIPRMCSSEETALHRLEQCEFNSFFAEACSRNMIDVCQCFLECELFDPSSYSEDLLIKLCPHRKAIEAMALLLDDDRLKISRNSRALIVACQESNIDMVQCLLDNGRIDPTARDNGALRVACECGSLSVVQALLRDPRVEPSAREFLLACKGRLMVVEALLKHPKIDPSHNESEAFMKACSSGNWDIMKMLIEDGRIDRVHAITKRSLSSCKRTAMNTSTDCSKGASLISVLRRIECSGSP